MRSEDAEPLPVAGGGSDDVVRGVVGVWLGRVRRELGDGAGQLWVAQGGKPLAGRAAGEDRSQALLQVAPVLLDVQGDAPRLRRASTQRRIDEMVRQCPALDVYPGLKGGDELSLVDEGRLQRKQAKKKITRRFGDHAIDSRSRRDTGLILLWSTSSVGRVVAL